MSEFIIVMGVSGSGKSTVGKLLAESLNGIFLEGDQYHPESNIDKMSSGVPLEDEDRWPWFDAMIADAEQRLESHNNVIAACSALKQCYRKYLLRNFPDQGKILFLEGSFETIQKRMKERDHFMPASLLKSQFETLEPPGGNDESKCLKVSIDQSVEEIVAAAEKWLTN